MSMPSWMKKQIGIEDAATVTPAPKPAAEPCVSPFAAPAADTAKPVVETVAEPVSKIVPTAEEKKPDPPAEPVRKQSEAGVFANSVKNALKNGQGKRMKSRPSK